MPGGDGTGSAGGGNGRMGADSRGTGGFCVCPACGHRQPHQRGEPCNRIRCPQCGATLTRE